MYGSYLNLLNGPNFKSLFDGGFSGVFEDKIIMCCNTKYVKSNKEQMSKNFSEAIM